MGLADGGVHVCNADLFIGTSARANAAVMLTSSLTLKELFQRQFEPEPATLPLPRSLKEVLTETARVREGASNPKEARQRIGAWALANPTATERGAPAHPHQAAKSPRSYSCRCREWRASGLRAHLRGKKR